MIAGITMLGVAAVEAVEAVHEVKKTGLPQLNSDSFTPQLFWLALTFGLLLLIMSRVALPRVAEVIEERQDRIDRDLEAAANLKGETDQALANYEQALADARNNASSIAKETRARLLSETDAEKAKVEADLSAKLQDAETRIAATKSKALSSVNDIATGTASAIVAKLIGQDVSADDVKRVLSANSGK